MKEVKVEMMEVEPPCPRCQAAKNVVEKVVEKLKAEGINVQIEKLNIASEKAVSKYGILISPALAINDTVKIMGRIPTEEEVKKLIREAAK